MRITSGKIESAQKVLVYGPEGIGKSTFAAQFPNPLFIDTEGSTKHLDVNRSDAPESWMMLLEQVTYVRLNPTVCSTLIIDTVDWAEALCVHHVCAKAQKGGIEDFGYGKGYTYLAEEFGRLLNLLTEVVDRGVNVVLTAHAAIRKFEQPDEMGAYDRWELKLQKKTAPLVKEWCDMVLFANYKTFAVKDENGRAKAAGGKRVMYATHNPAWDAKNRHGLPDEMAFDFAAIAHTLPAATSVSAPSKEAPKPEAPAPAPVADKPAEVVVIHHDKPAPAPAASHPAHLSALYQLMEKDGATDEEVRKVVADKGYFPFATTLDKYPADFVEGVLVGAWPQVLATINASKQTSLDVPFN